MTRCGRAGTLRSLVTSPRSSAPSGPFIQEATYPDVLVAKAANANGVLSSVLYPGERSGKKALTIGGLAPNNSYVATGAVGEFRFAADTQGTARFELPVDGRTELQIERTG